MFKRILSRTRRYLDIGLPPRKADLIFVFAGRPERKRYGLHLYRQGYADRLLLSVGRFEWRRFPNLGLINDGGLIDLVQATPPPKRHFFVLLEGERATCSGIPRRRLGTLSEAIAFSEYVDRESVQTVLAVTSRTHLRRATRSLQYFCSERNQQLIPVAVPLEFEDTPNESAGAIWKEFSKLLLYRGLLAVRGEAWLRFM